MNNGSEFAGLQSKAAGVPRGMAPLVGGRSPRRGAGSGASVGGGKRSLLPQKADVGDERADEPYTPSLFDRNDALC
jgi:hypothetical protein